MDASVTHGPPPPSPSLHDLPMQPSRAEDKKRVPLTRLAVVVRDLYHKQVPPLVFQHCLQKWMSPSSSSPATGRGPREIKTVGCLHACTFALPGEEQLKRETRWPIRRSSTSLETIAGRCHQCTHQLARRCPIHRGSALSPMRARCTHCGRHKVRPKGVHGFGPHHPPLPVSPPPLAGGPREPQKRKTAKISKNYGKIPAVHQTIA